MLTFEGKNQERKMRDHIKKNKDIREDDERLKRQEKKRKTVCNCVSSLIFLINILFYLVIFDISFKVSYLHLLEVLF